MRGGTLDLDNYALFSLVAGGRIFGRPHFAHDRRTMSPG